MTEEERNQRDMRRRERERRHGSSSKDAKGNPKPSRRMDIIDKLDATGIYGLGSEYSLTFNFRRVTFGWN